MFDKYDQPNNNADNKRPRDEPPKFNDRLFRREAIKGKIEPSKANGNMFKGVPGTYGKIIAHSDGSITIGATAYADDAVAFISAAIETNPTIDDEIKEHLRVFVRAMDARAVKKHGYNRAPDQAAINFDDMKRYSDSESFAVFIDPSTVESAVGVGNNEWQLTFVSGAIQRVSVENGKQIMKDRMEIEERKKDSSFNFIPDSMKNAFGQDAWAKTLSEAAHYMQIPGREDPDKPAFEFGNSREAAKEKSDGSFSFGGMD